MRLAFLFLILLAFPVAELWLLLELGQRYGWWLLFYLVLMIILGWRLILDEKLMLLGRFTEILVNGGTPAKAIFGGAKNLLAAILLILPGVMSDVLAIILLLLPAPKIAPQASSAARAQGKAANDDVIEGEYRRED